MSSNDIVQYLMLHTLQPCHVNLHRPSNICKTCDSLNVRIAAEEDPAAKQQLQLERQLHHCKAEKAYHQLKEDTALCCSSPEIDMITFDLGREFKGTETRGHARTRKGTPLKTSIFFEHISQKKQ